MASDDQIHWDSRWMPAGIASMQDIEPPPALADQLHLLPSTGDALDVACGRGTYSVWLARRGLQVTGVDVSPVAITNAEEFAHIAEVEARTRFFTVDLDAGLPPGEVREESLALVLCHRFSAPALDDEITRVLAPGGVLAMVTLSEVGAEPGRFRTPAGALLARFNHLELLYHHEAHGEACLIARRTG